MGIKRIAPIPPSSSQRKSTFPKIGHIMFYEKDGLPLPGINPTTNNYPPGRISFPYYLAVNGLDYYDVENGETYYDYEEF